MAERGPAVDTDAGWPGSATTSRRWMRDLDALLALPALWADHEPLEIATGLLSVLFSILELTGGYARFDDPDTGRALETWRPSGAEMPFELRFVLQTDLPEGPGMRTTEAPGNGRGPLRVTSVPVVLPWESGLVLVSAPRADFPTAMEAHLLGVAVGQAAIAIHTARRLARADSARASAEDTVRRQNELLQSLVDEVDPSLRTIARRVHEASRLVAEVGASRPDHGRRTPSAGPVPSAGATTRIPTLPLTPRESEVLGLLAQGLSNKEIAGMMRLSYRTVERHVTSLYRKIGVGRRSAATAFALRQGRL